MIIIEALVAYDSLGTCVDFKRLMLMLMLMSIDPTYASHGDFAAGDGDGDDADGDADAPAGC